MLVRFLSYAASVIGAKRYKPLLISCLALIFSITGISIVASSITSSSPDAASQVGQQGDRVSQKGQQQTSLGGLQQKSTKEAEEDAIRQQNQQTQSKSEDQQATPSPTNSTPLELTLNTTMVSLSQTSPNTAVTVAVNNSKDIVWSMTPETQNGVTAHIESVKDNTGSAVVRFRAESFTPGTYQFTVIVKNAGGQSASKTISVTVN